MQKFVALLCSVMLMILASWDVPVYGITVWGKVTYDDNIPVSRALVTFIDEEDTTRVFGDPTAEGRSYTVSITGVKDSVVPAERPFCHQGYST